MAISDAALDDAYRNRPRIFAKHAHFNESVGEVVIALNTGVTLSFAVSRVEALADADPSHLSVIEISPSGLGLHWPELDADLYVPGIIDGVFASTAVSAAVGV